MEHVEQNETDSSSSERPLCVDLDGTLIKTDLLAESSILLLKKNPLHLIPMTFSLLVRGRAGLKRYVAQRVALDPKTLPYNSDFLEFLKKEKGNGRKLALASASDELLVGPVSVHLGLFDEVLASDGKINLKGKRKVEQLVSKFGEHGFDYAGNEVADFKVWEHSDKAIVVSTTNSFVRAAERRFSVERSFVRRRDLVKSFLRAIRVHQWVKNLLLFVPVLMAHEIGRSELLMGVANAFIAFCLCASSVYLLNDLTDLDSDRQHRYKKNRPLASGSLPLSVAFITIPLFLALSFLIARSIGQDFLISLLAYFALTLAYSLYLKRIALVDIILLASLYSIRILAGGYAVGVPVSQWLVAFSMFLFFSLACVKRYSEVYVLRKHQHREARGRGYVAEDLEQIAQFGAASGYISILVLALYINSKEVTTLYSHPLTLWLVCPLLFYWVSRVWLLASRGRMHDDPIVFALGDVTSYIVCLLGILVVVLSV